MRLRITEGEDSAKETAESESVELEKLPKDIEEMVRKTAKIGRIDLTTAGIALLRELSDRVELENAAYNAHDSAWAMNLKLDAAKIHADMRTVEASISSELRTLSDSVKRLQKNALECANMFRLAVVAPMPPMPRELKPESMRQSGCLANDEDYASAMAAAVGSKTHIGRMDALADMIKRLTETEADFRRALMKLEARVKDAEPGTPEKSVAVRLSTVKRGALDTCWRASKMRQPERAK